MQIRDESYGQDGDWYNGLASRPTSSSYQNKKDHYPTGYDYQSERYAELCGQFERRAVCDIPYAPDRNIPTAVSGKTPLKCAQAGSEPLIIFDDSQRRLIGRQPPLVCKARGIDARLDLPAKNLKQYQCDSHRSDHGE